MSSANPFKDFWIGVIDKLSPEMFIYVFVMLVGLMLFSLKERLMFLVIVDIFFMLILMGVAFYKWGLLSPDRSGVWN